MIRLQALCLLPPSTSAEEASEKPFLLNSRRLTGPYVMCVLKVMGLPMRTRAATDETRVMIDRKLAEVAS